MKASENGYIQRYINEVCYPIDYAEVRLGALLNTPEDKYRVSDIPVAYTNTRALVRTDRSPLSYPMDSILLDVHSKGRANRKYENSNTQEVDRVGYKVLDNNHFIPKIIEALDNTNIDCTNAANFTLRVSTDNASTYHNIASTISVPADSTLVVIDKNSAFYLDETDLLRIVGSSNGDLTYLVSGEKITD